jgi:hypothetical protein
VYFGVWDYDLLIGIGLRRELTQRKTRIIMKL